MDKVITFWRSMIHPWKPIMDFAYFAVIKDHEGNFLGLWEDVKDR